MYKNYLIVAIRNIQRQKFYAFINIGGLSVGLTVSLLILIFVAHEFSFDKFNKNGDRIFRVEKQFSRDGRYSLYANPLFAPAIKDLDPHVENYVRLYDRGRKVLESDNQHRFFENQLIFADTSFFSIFSFELVRGKRSALARPNTVVVTERTAAKYFGDEDLMGKTLIYDKDYSFEIVGIAKNPPSNSSLQFDFVASFNSLLTMPERAMILNNSSGFPTYLLLMDKKYLPDVQRSILKTDYTNTAITYSLSPLFENHFNLHFGDVANTQYVFIFLCAGLLILALALINYMNLTTARATTRAKEVGVRKVIGARQKTLSVQFYLESAVMTVISFGLALILIIALKPAFLNILQIHIDNSFLSSAFFIMLVIGLLITSILLSGSYPALILPRFKPVMVLKGKFSASGQGAWLRKSLTVFQFAISVGLIVCTVVMYRQLHYMLTKKIGLQREQVMAVPIYSQAKHSSYQALKTQLSQQSGVLGVSCASISLYKTDMSGVSLVRSPITQEQVGTKWIKVDEDFLNVLDISWLEKPESNLMGGNFIINETAARAFGFDDKLTGYDFTMGSAKPMTSTAKSSALSRILITKRCVPELNRW